MSIEILKETGALLEGHFLLSSGRHSDRYAQNAKLLQYPDKAAEVLSVVAEKVKDLDLSCQTFGTVLSSELFNSTTVLS